MILATYRDAAKKVLGMSKKFSKLRIGNMEKVQRR